MGIIYMPTPLLKGQGVSPYPSSRPFSPVSAMLSTSVSDDSGAPCPRFGQARWEASCDEPPVGEPLAYGRVNEALQTARGVVGDVPRSEEHTSELQSPM